MTVFYDRATEQQRSASAATVTLTHTATTGNVVGVAIAFVKGGASGATDNISAVSYGGVSLLRVNRATDTATEPGAAEWWFAPTTLGGTQTVQYNSGAPGSNIHVVVVTVTGNGTPYVIGADTVSQNTASSTASLTTGYVSGLALGAFYGGGAEPATYTYTTAISEIHNWDMGAFYSEVFRRAVTPAASEFEHNFGGTPAAADDVAYAAIYITDGGIDAGLGALTVAGLQPTVYAELQVGVGTATTGAAGLVPDLYDDAGELIRARVRLRGLAPTLELTAGSGSETTVSPTTGLITIVGEAPEEWRDTLIEPGVGLVTIGGLQPDELREQVAAPGVGAITLAGALPTELCEIAPAPGVGTAAVMGLAPTIGTENRITPTQGIAIINGLAPTVSGELTQPGTANPGVGLVTMAGLSPSITDENTIAPATGLAVVQGLAPTLELTAPVTDATVTPSVGLATLTGLAPSYGGLIGRSYGRRRGTYGPLEYSLGADPRITEAAPPMALPQPEPLRVPLAAFANLDLRAAAQPAIQPDVATDDEERRARIRARRRREEMAIISILMAA